MRWRRLVPFVVFLATTVAFMPKAIFGGGTYVAVDILEQTAPYRDAIGRPPHVVSITQGDQVEVVPPGAVAFTRELKHGHWQRWEPRIAAGMPGGISPLNGILSPFAWPYLVLPAWYAIGFRIALSLLFAQVFCYLFFRRLAVARWAATVGAVAYTFTGTNIVLIHRVTAVFVLPALLWAVHRVVTERRYRDVLVLAGLVAWTWFEGFPAGFVYCVDATAAWAIALAGTRLWRDTRARDGTGWKDAGLRLGAVGAGMAWGVGVAAVTLVPLVNEVTRRGILEAREFAHLPGLDMYALATYEIPGPPLAHSFWASYTPVEGTAAVGMIVVAGAAVALVLGSLARLRLTADQQVAWGFASVVGPAVLLLSYADTPLSRVAEHVPGLANNPIWRSRFLIAMCAVILLVLLLDALWRQRSDRATGVRTFGPAAVWLSRAAVLVVGGMALRFLPRLVDAADAAHVLDDIGRDIVENLDVAAVAAAIVVVGVLRSRLVPLCAVAITGLVFWQVAWPVRDFTPTAPRDDFYTTQSGHRVLQRMTHGRYRIAASSLNFYPDQSTIIGLYDVRGAGLHAPRFRHLLEQAVPNAYKGDPFKAFFDRDTWKQRSAALDDLSVRYFALGTDEEPYGAPVLDDGSWLGWADAPTVAGLAPVRAPGGFDAIQLPLRGRGECRRGHVVVDVLGGARRVARTSRPLNDVYGGWLPFAIRASGVPPASDVRLRVRSTSRACRLQVGLAPDGRPARPAVKLLALPKDSPLRLVSTDQAWIYERPSARPIVTTFARWRHFATQRDALRYLRTRPAGERDVAPVVGRAPASPSRPGRGTATVRRREIGVNDVHTTVDARRETLVSLGQVASGGWQVEVDGDDAETVRIDGALLGVFVPPGVHEVSATYRPRSFSIGAAVSLLSLLAAVVGAAVCVVRARRRRARRGAGEDLRPDRGAADSMPPVRRSR